MERDDRIRARRLWLDGRSTDAEIAKTLALDEAAIARWREDEDWAELRDIIDMRVAMRRETSFGDAESRAIILCDALDNLAAKLATKGATTMKAADLKACAELLRITEQVRARARTSIDQREHDQKK